MIHKLRVVTINSQHEYETTDQDEIFSQIMDEEIIFVEVEMVSECEPVDVPQTKISMINEGFLVVPINDMENMPSNTWTIMETLTVTSVTKMVMEKSYEMRMIEISVMVQQ